MVQYSTSCQDYQGKEVESMEVRIIDHDGNPITSSQLTQLNLWNPTADHVCASTIQRVWKLEDCDTALSLENG